MLPSLLLFLCGLVVGAGAAASGWAHRPFSSTSGAYTGPFTQLTADFLDGVADPTDRFGPDDKLVVANNQLIFIDLEAGAERQISMDIATSTWTSTAITALPCPDRPADGLLPRDNGYVVGVTSGPSGDRLIIVGGNDAEQSNVFFSDDSGLTWNCNDAPQIWDAVDFNSLIHAKGILPGDPLIFAGGQSTTSFYSEQLFLSYDYGMTYSRPLCPNAGNCANPLPAPDPIGACTNSTYQQCYTLPELPALAGSLAADWSNLYLFIEASDTFDGGHVFNLNATNYPTGWTRVDNSTDSDSYGRKTFIRGGAQGTGCWFGTDWLAEDLWVIGYFGVESTNSFVTSPSILGPWFNWTQVGLTAPWAPRASAALTAPFSGTVAYFASGMAFSEGQASLPSYGDAWQIDVGICLLAPSTGLVCNNNGVPDLFNVLCICNPGASGPYCETLATISASPFPTPFAEITISASPFPTPFAEITVSASPIPILPEASKTPIPILPEASNTPIPILPEASRSPFPILPEASSSPAPGSGGSGSATGSGASPPNAAGAVFGTLFALVAVAAAIAFFLPTWGFAVGGTRIVPAAGVRYVAGGIYSGGAWVVGKVQGLINGAAPGSGVRSTNAASWSSSSSSYRTLAVPTPTYSGGSYGATAAAPPTSYNGGGNL